MEWLGGLMESEGMDGDVYGPYIAGMLEDESSSVEERLEAVRGMVESVHEGVRARWRADARARAG